MHAQKIEAKSLLPFPNRSEKALGGGGGGGGGGGVGGVG